jgi:hypothetical protein
MATPSRASLDETGGNLGLLRGLCHKNAAYSLMPGPASTSLKGALLISSSISPAVRNKMPGLPSSTLRTPARTFWRIVAASRAGHSKMTMPL